ncbi:TetR/AcrR family transcriptional regulator [Streptomyces sp. URMC 123]|uniref:TetR/AcrR family transcriptional regulator n=1 Tax=Streptomyces sp. URMC 123 TaxID=3423403 RepID=UPI003F1C5115
MPEAAERISDTAFMTRHADADTRRAQIADALMSTVAERGLARTALADVAATAGVSVGLVQRYFRTKGDLLGFGVEWIYDRARERVREVEITLPVRAVVVRMMETFLPLDDEREMELKVWLNFLQASLTDPGMAATHQAAARDLRDGLVEALSGAQRAGELADDIDVAAEATALIAFVDGLSLHHAVTGEGYAADDLRAALVRYVDRLFDGGAAAR